MMIEQITEDAYIVRNTPRDRGEVHGTYPTLEAAKVAYLIARSAGI